MVLSSRNCEKEDICDRIGKVQRGRNLVAQNEWNVPQADLLLFDSAGKTSQGWGFAFEITEDMKILNSVKERVKPYNKGFGMQKEGDKNQKPDEVMNQGSGTLCHPKDKGKRRSSHHWVLLQQKGGNGDPSCMGQLSNRSDDVRESGDQGRAG